MKIVFTFATFLWLICSIQANQNGSDWIQLQLTNGLFLNGYVLQVTEKNVHLVSSSINQLVPLSQLSEKSREDLSARFPVTVKPEPEGSSTAASLKADLQIKREQLYESVSDLYSPSPYRYRRYGYGYGPYHRSYYLPLGYSFRYPAYRHYYRPSYSSPTFSIKIDL